MGKYSKYLTLAVKGMCMGAADVIPGVSGGTIAFITGIYNELVHSISSVDRTAVGLLFKGKFKEFWKHINGNFLVAVFAGVLVSILSLAKLMTYLLVHHPIPTWAFFFGLIVASSIFILKGIQAWKVKDAVLLVVGIVLGVTICTLTPGQSTEALYFVFISGAIAICAMILPGISGSFILLILGKYEFILGTVAKITSGEAQAMDFVVILMFLLGAVFGLLVFAKFLNWLMEKYYRGTLLVMAGFIIGSLVKVWPWSDKMTIISSQFPEAAMLAESGVPQEQIIETFGPQIDPHIGLAIVFAILGFGIVTGLELVSAAKRRSAAKADETAEIAEIAGKE